MRIQFDPQELRELPISVDPEILSGAPVFKGTRVPIEALWENLASGCSVDGFLENFPTVDRAQVLQLLHFAEQSSLMAASSSNGGVQRAAGITASGSDKYHFV